MHENSPVHCEVEVKAFGSPRATTGPMSLISKVGEWSLKFLRGRRQ